MSASQKRKGIDLMTTQPTLVFEELLDRIGGDREFAVELLNEWVETLDKEIAELAKAVERKDSEGVRYRAHTLKGAASNLALENLPGLPPFARWPPRSLTSRKPRPRFLNYLMRPKRSSPLYRDWDKPS